MMNEQPGFCCLLFIPYVQVLLVVISVPRMLYDLRVPHAILAHFGELAFQKLYHHIFYLFEIAHSI